MKSQIAILASILLFACSKEGEFETSRATGSAQPKAAMNEKYMDMENETDPCQPGPAYCTYYCCVTPEFTELIHSIENREEREYLASINIADISNGDNAVKEAFENVRDGLMSLSYTEYGANVGFAMVSNITPSDVVHYVVKK